MASEVFSAGKAARAACEAGDLQRVERIVRQFGRDEMAHQQIGAARARGGDRGAQRVERFEAEPVHAGVEVQRRRRRPALRARERRPALELRRAADRRREAEGGVVGERVGLRLQPVEHVDARVGVRQQRPQPLALADVGDEEGAAAGGVERRRDVSTPRP